MCGGQARFAYFSGQFRTFARNVRNRDSFLSGSGEGCWVQVLYTYDEIDSPRFLYGYSTKDVVEAAAGYRSAVPGAFAFLVARRLARPRPDILPGVVRFASLVAERHGLRRSAANVIVVSRPDILFSHAFDHPQLQAYALRPGSPPFILFPSHQGENLIVNDPSEMLLLASRALLEDPCVASCASWRQIRGGCRSESGCHGGSPFRGCGYYGSKWIVAGGERGYDACFMRPLMRLVLARPENDPGAWLEVGGGKGPRPGPNKAMLPGPPMRLLEGLRCARDYGACDCARIGCGVFDITFQKWQLPPGGGLLEDFARNMQLVRSEVFQPVFHSLDQDGDGVISFSEHLNATPTLAALRGNVSQRCPATLVAENVSFRSYRWCEPDISAMYVSNPGGLVPRSGG
ncbi:unnamed protein product [Polarella glacialis]|uniref:EF-hand domain-containing protein n=1 Tax=Polarella glacialis TaxID=89957 RepID=A0A813KMD0_POLGL|nr:unnamed protein product [Polarella glacialis]